MKKLQSLSDSKFNPLSTEAMKLVVGGDKICTGAGSIALADGTTFKWSSDCTDESSTYLSPSDASFGCKVAGEVIDSPVGI